MAIKKEKKAFVITVASIAAVLELVLMYSMYRNYEEYECRGAIEFAKPHITKMCEEKLGNKECSKLEFVCGHDIDIGLDYWLVYGNLNDNGRQFGGYVRGSSKRGFKTTFLPGERLWD